MRQDDADAAGQQPCKGDKKRTPCAGDCTGQTRQRRSFQELSCQIHQTRTIARFAVFRHKPMIPKTWKKYNKKEERPFNEQSRFPRIHFLLTN